MNNNAINVAKKLKFNITLLIYDSFFITFENPINETILPNTEYIELQLLSDENIDTAVKLIKIPIINKIYLCSYLFHLFFYQNNLLLLSYFLLICLNILLF